MDMDLFISDGVESILLHFIKLLQHGELKSAKRERDMSFFSAAIYGNYM